jgi:hypothetical protein
MGPHPSLEPGKPWGRNDADPRGLKSLTGRGTFPFQAGTPSNGVWQQHLCKIMKTGLSYLMQIVGTGSRSKENQALMERNIIHINRENCEPASSILVNILLLNPVFLIFL